MLQERPDQYNQLLVGLASNVQAARPPMAGLIGRQHEPQTPESPGDDPFEHEHALVDEKRRMRSISLDKASRQASARLQASTADLAGDFLRLITSLR